MQGRGLEVEKRRVEEEDGKERDTEAHRNTGSGLHPCDRVLASVPTAACLTAFCGTVFVALLPSWQNA